MTAERIDRILVGLGAMLILISSGQLFFQTRDVSSGSKLATLTSTFSVVKTKKALALDWKDAVSGNDLAENQLIYTDAKSSAEVSFPEGSSINLGENSLIKLTSKGSGKGVDLTKGFITAKIQKARPLRFNLNGEDYTISGNNADVQILLNDKIGQIGVVSGNVKVAGKGVSENLSSANKLDVDKNSISKKAVYFSNLVPSNGATFFTANSALNVDFKWEPLEQAKALVSRSISFDQTFETDSTLSLSPGTYYYKVINEKGESLITQFEIIQESPPELLRPLDGEKVTLKEESSSKILLQWLDNKNLQYQVEWFNGESYSELAQGASALIDINPNIPFSWRLRIYDPKRPEAIWTEWQGVNIDVIALPSVPTELSPNEVEYQTYQSPQEEVEFSWRGTGNTEIEIKRPDGKLISDKTEINSFKYLASSAGKYSWRVRSMDAYLRTSRWSEWKNFSIKDLSRERTEGVQRIQLKKPNQGVTFSWEAEEGTTSIFELSKDANFTSVIKRVEITSDTVKVNIPETGAYFWRSQKFLKDGSLHVSEPKRVIIEPTPAPEKPAKLPDLEVPLLEGVPNTTLIEKFFDFVISSAHAEESKGVVRINLPVKEDSKAYVVRIFRDPNLTELVYEEEITSKTFEWDQAEAGVFYWQYAVIDFWNRKSPFSDASKLTVKEEELPPPDMPRLRVPIRAVEIENTKLNFYWTKARYAKNYELEVSRKRNFKDILLTRRLAQNSIKLPDQNLKPGLYFWRVRAFNQKNKSTLSNTGRFKILPPLEKTIIEDIPTKKKRWRKSWKNRGFIAWVPSMDNYTFSDGKKGEIAGTPLMSFLLSGTTFEKNYILNGELLRQSGEVFDGESYLFQRIMIDGSRSWNRGHYHKIAAGLAVGQTSGQAYEIEASEQVKSKAVSGLNYGVVVRDYFAINPEWEVQSKAMYLLGTIKQLELSADVIKEYHGFLLSGGLGYSSRSYEINSGEQSSLRIAVGIGKEF